jgi:type IV secretory pathway VirB10-like protein
LPLRVVVVAIVGTVVVAIGACEKPKNRTPDAAAITAAIEKARREDAQADRRMREHAAQQERERREAEQAAVDGRAAQEEARRSKQLRFEEQVRGALIDPGSMQIRGQRLNAEGTALCAEVSAKNTRGIYVGFRRVVVTESSVSFDKDPEDNYREPEHRFAAIARLTGCF